MHAVVISDDRVRLNFRPLELSIVAGGTARLTMADLAESRRDCCSSFLSHSHRSCCDIATIKPWCRSWQFRRHSEAPI